MNGNVAAEAQGTPGEPRAPGLLEREGELAALSHAFSDARSGRGSVVVLDGPPGIGKSSLLGAARELAEAKGMDVLTASGRELESEFGFSVALQLFEARLTRAGEGERERLLSGAAQPVAQLLATGPGAPVSEDQAFSLLHGFYRVCANLSERGPLVMLVDDANWADSPSLQFILYLAQRVEELPVAVVVASRTISRDRGPAELAQIAEHPATTESHLRPLSAAGVAAWLRGMGLSDVHDRFWRACFQATGGQPALLRELGAEVISQGIRPDADGAARVPELGPDAIARAILLRVRPVGEGATELVRALAVAGDGSELRHCAELAGLDAGDAGWLADQLADVDVLQHSDRLAFAYPVVRQAIYAQLPAAERAAAHLRVAVMLMTEGAPDQRIAPHLLLSPRAGNAEVVHALLDLAGGALREGTPDSAVLYLRRALEEPPASDSRAAVMLALGRAEAVAGEPEAVDRLSQAVELIDDPRQRALTSLDIGRALYIQGRHRDAVGAFHRGAIEAGDDRELRLQLHTAHTLVGGIIGLPASELARTAPPPITDEVDARETPAGRLLLAHLSLERALRGAPREDVINLAHAALGRGALLEDETSDGLGFYFAASALIIAEDLQAAELALSTAVEDARSRGSVLGYATACYFRSWATLRRGRVDDAAADAQSALAGERYGWRMGLPGAHAILARAFTERGEYDNAEHELTLGAERAAASGEIPLPFLAYMRGRLRLHQRNPELALADFRECGERMYELGAANPGCLAWRSGAALAHAQLGEKDLAVTLLEEDIELARAVGAPGPIGRSLHALGNVLNGDGTEMLIEAVDTLSDSQAALDRARALVDLGAFLRRDGKRRAAREPLREGLDLAERCGARALAARALEETLAAGARPRRTALHGVEALTPRERQVAGLAAQGMSNREIAESLFVTVKTVEWHLRHSYEKLGIDSRRELGSTLAGRR